MPGTYEAERLIHPFTGEEIFYPMGLGGKHNTHNPYHVQYTDPAGNCVLYITDEIWYDGTGVLDVAKKLSKHGDAQLVRRST